jgi:hypothetical protein
MDDGLAWRGCEARSDECGNAPQRGSHALSAGVPAVGMHHQPSADKDY